MITIPARLQLHNGMEFRTHRGETETREPESYEIVFIGRIWQRGKSVAHVLLQRETLVVDPAPRLELHAKQRVRDTEPFSLQLELLARAVFQ